MCLIRKALATQAYSCISCFRHFHFHSSHPLTSEKKTKKNRPYSLKSNSEAKIFEHLRLRYLQHLEDYNKLQSYTTDHYPTFLAPTLLVKPYSLPRFVFLEFLRHSVLPSLRLLPNNTTVSQVHALPKPPFFLISPQNLPICQDGHFWNYGKEAGQKG